MNPGDQTSRLLDLAFWLRGTGCCSLCALGLAVAQVERETDGRAFDAGEDRCKLTEADGKTPRDCRAKARKAWGTMPPNPFVAAEKTRAA